MFLFLYEEVKAQKGNDCPKVWELIDPTENTSYFSLSLLDLNAQIYYYFISLDYIIQTRHIIDWDMCPQVFLVLSIYLPRAFLLALLIFYFKCPRIENKIAKLIRTIHQVMGSESESKIFLWVKHKSLNTFLSAILATQDSLCVFVCVCAYALPKL